MNRLRRLRTRAADVLRVIARLLQEHANAIVFAVGFAALLRGISFWSPPVAWMTAGAVLMVVSAWPYLLLLTRKR